MRRRPGTSALWAHTSDHTGPLEPTRLRQASANGSAAASTRFCLLLFSGWINRQQRPLSTNRRRTSPPCMRSPTGSPHRRSAAPSVRERQGPRQTAPRQIAGIVTRDDLALVRRLVAKSDGSKKRQQSPSTAPDLARSSHAGKTRRELPASAAGCSTSVTTSPEVRSKPSSRTMASSLPRASHEDALENVPRGSLGRACGRRLFTVEVLTGADWSATSSCSS